MTEFEAVEIIPPIQIVLEKEQQGAVDAVVKWFKSEPDKRFVLAGYAGTGKSTLIPFILRALKLDPDDGSAAFVAFTGKATLVLRSKGLPATTVHRLIYEPFTEDDGSITFIRRQMLDPAIRLIIVDEGSMVTEEMSKDLECYGIPVLYAGDSGQVEPVGSKNDALMANPTYALLKIHRQAEKSPIIRLATMIREGKNIPYGSYGRGVRKIHEADLNDDMYLNADQILCGTNDTRKAINTIVREHRGFNEDTLMRGEKVICLKNNWQLGLINGMIGTVQWPGTKGSGPFANLIMKFGFKSDEGEEFNWLNVDALAVNASKNTQLVWRKDIQQFDYGSAITIHKSQGSQYNKVLIFEEKFGDSISHRRLMYTATTRAIHGAIIVT